MTMREYSNSIEKTVVCSITVKGNKKGFKKVTLQENAELFTTGFDRSNWSCLH